MSDLGDKQRIAEIDALKAAAVVTVVLIHSLRALWDPGYTYIERITSEMLRYAVPCFLAVSGFLYYADEAIGIDVLGRRLRRILLPYALASVAAYAYVLAYPQYGPGTSFVWCLALASTFGPYYYVFVLVEFVLATWLLSRLPQSWVLPITLLSLIAALVPILWFREGRELTVWTLRNPMLSSCWFMMGWAAAANAERFSTFVRNNATSLLAAWALAVLLWLVFDYAAPLPRRLARTSSLFLIAANILGIFVLATKTRIDHTVVRALSDRTYAIYLWHLFFIYTVFNLFGETRNTHPLACTMTAWAAGLAGSLAIIEAAKRLVPSWSKDVIGA